MARAATAPGVSTAALGRAAAVIEDRLLLGGWAR
jgi:hypothetical protein